MIRCVTRNQVQDDWGCEVCTNTVQQYAARNACAAAFLTIAYDEVTGHETEGPESYEDTRNILFSIMMKRIHDFEMGPQNAMQPLKIIGSAEGSTFTSELELTLQNASKKSVSDNDLYNTMHFGTLGGPIEIHRNGLVMSLNIIFNLHWVQDRGSCALICIARGISQGKCNDEYRAKVKELSARDPIFSEGISAVSKACDDIIHQKLQCCQPLRNVIAAHMVRSLEEWTTTFLDVCPKLVRRRSREVLKNKAGIKCEENDLKDLKLVRVYSWAMAFMDTSPPIIWYDERFQKVLQSRLNGRLAIRGINLLPGRNVYVGYDLESTEEMVLLVASNASTEAFNENAGLHHFNICESNKQSIFVFKNKIY